MKRLIAAMTALALLCAGLCAGAYAASDVTSVTILGTRAFEPLAELQVRLLAGTTEDLVCDTVEKSALSFSIGDTQLPLKGEPVSGQGISYIFVVDCSAYYSTRFDFATVKSFLDAAISSMQPQDRCAFILAGQTVTTNNFIDKQSAQTFVQALSQEKKLDDCKLYDALDAAVKLAETTSDAVPAQKLIAVVSDGLDTGSTVTKDALRATLGASGAAPVICVAMYRSKFSSSREGRNEEINTARNDFVNLSSLTKGFYAILDSDTESVSAMAVSAGQRVTTLGKSVIFVTLDITGVSLLSGGSDSYDLRLYYASGTRTLSASAKAAIYASQIPTPTPAPTVEVTEEPYPMLEESSDNIRYVQYRLKKLYYFASEENGVLDAETQEAMDRFCENNGLPIMPGVSMEAYELMKSGEAKAEATATPVPVDPKQKFAMGNTGSEVRDAQYLLKSLGYYAEIVENSAEESFGTFDQAMQLATDAFCRINGVSTSDGMSKEAWELLRSAKAVAAPTPTYTPGPSRDPNIRLALGDEGAEVRMAENRLEELYYFTRAAGDENYGKLDMTMQRAVDSFCKANDLATVDGMSYAAWELLMNGQPLPKATAVPEETYAAIQTGEASANVNAYQIRLKELDYFKGDFTPGVFDEATQTAQDRLCEVNAIAAESGASTALQEFVFSASILPNVTPDLLTQIREFMLSSLALFGFEVPMWTVVLCCAVLAAGVIVAIVLLLKSAHHKTGEESAPIPVVYGDLGGGVSSDPPTADTGAPGEDPPTSVNVGGWHIALMVDYAGMSTDSTYTMNEGMPLIIGRGSDADIMLNKDDLSVSRHHGQFMYRGSVLYYTDSSKMGSIVDGQMVHGSECALHPGSTLDIGKHHIKLEMK